MNREFTLREMEPSDSAALTELFTDPTGQMVTHFISDTFTAMTESDEHRAQGVVIETTKNKELVGAATVSFGMMQFNGDLLPFAILSSLHVHPDYRRRGLGWQLAEWRVERARAEFGEKGVIITGLSVDNDASRATAHKWSREFLEPIEVAITPVRHKAPNTLPGIAVREIESSELTQAIEKQNTFYKDYNLYEPLSPDTLAEMLAVSVNGKPANRYYVAVSPSGEILAGVRTRHRGIYMVDTFENPPLPMRLMNKLLHFMPPDFTIREVQALGLWHLPGQLQAGQHLWQMMRWLVRDVGSPISMGYDDRGPLPRIMQLKPWRFPRIQVAYALHGPAPLDRSRLYNASGRR